MRTWGEARLNLKLPRGDRPSGREGHRPGTRGWAAGALVFHGAVEDTEASPSAQRAAVSEWSPTELALRWGGARQGEAERGGASRALLTALLTAGAFWPSDSGGPAASAGSGAAHVAQLPLRVRGSHPLRGIPRVPAGPRFGAHRWSARLVSGCCGHREARECISSARLVSGSCQGRTGAAGAAGALGAAELREVEIRRGLSGWKY